MEEKNYNRRHSAVRNKIEGVIGDIKNRFGLLRNKYRSIKTQSDMIVIACAIHNHVVRKQYAS